MNLEVKKDIKDINSENSYVLFKKIKIDSFGKLTIDISTNAAQIPSLSLMIAKSTRLILIKPDYTEAFVGWTIYKIEATKILAKVKIENIT